VSQDGGRPALARRFPRFAPRSLNQQAHAIPETIRSHLDAKHGSLGRYRTGMFTKKYGFQVVEVMLVAHGLSHNDTLVCVERKVKG
jgi:hypothetical protein